jgi:hypothetical protein
MSLKCPYLAKIALNDIFKNANTIWKSADNCPFMKTAVRTLSDDVKRNVVSSKNAASFLNKGDLIKILSKIFLISFLIFL